MTASQRDEELGNDPRLHRAKALEAQEVAKELEAKRLASGEWEWVQVDSKTYALKKKQNYNLSSSRRTRKKTAEKL